MSDYQEFIRNREQAPPEEGFAPVFVHDGLRDFQSHLVEWATRRARTAILADCGLGKTPIQLVWAENVVRKTNGRVLVLAPLAVAAQTIREGEKFGVECRRSRDGKVNGAGIYVTNYEKLDKFDSSDFVAVVCDESSILKSFDGVRRQQITSFMRKMPFRLLCTATAAPNDYDELGTSSEALGHLGYMDMLARFFVADDGRGSAARRGWGKEVKFRLKGHAELPFWRWVCSWAMAVRSPSDLGYDDGEFVLPPLVENVHVVGVSNLPRGFLFEPTARNMREERDATRRSIEERCAKAVELASDGPCLLWCNLNDEGNLLAGSIPGAVQVAGSDADEAKEERLLGFANGEIRVLVTKPKIGAFGMNFQRCAHVVTFPTHSYERHYQGVRRCWRFGQTRQVTVDVIGTDGLEWVMENLRRKARQADEMFDRLVATTREARGLNVERALSKMETPKWIR